jgi:cysteine desulfurase
VAIYFDHAATTPISPLAMRIFEEQMAKVGNPSSLHSQGRAIRRDVEEARESLARVIHCQPGEVVFTASGTEADNLAIKGFYWMRRRPDRNLILLSAFEHHAVLDAVHWLVEHEGAEAIYLPVTRDGFLDIDSSVAIIDKERDRIAVITAMHSNNEIGTLQPITQLVTLAGDIPVHIDAVQSLGKVPLDFAELGVTSMALSGHKVGGPLGTGALILRRGIDITPILHGGGQERDIRSGTLNAPGICAFSAAAVDSVARLDEISSQVTALREYAEAEIVRTIPSARINGSRERRLPGIMNFQFPGVLSDDLLLLLDAQGVATSTGSACSAGVPEASHVLLAMGLSDDQARSSLRISLGVTNTREEIDRFIALLPDVIARASQARTVRR